MCYTEETQNNEELLNSKQAELARLSKKLDGFDWYLRFDGDPEKPLHCLLQGKRKTNTKIMVSTGLLPAMDCSPTGCH